MSPLKMSRSKHSDFGPLQFAADLIFWLYCGLKTSIPADGFLWWMVVVMLTMKPFIVLFGDDWRFSDVSILVMRHNCNRKWNPISVLL